MVSQKNIVAFLAAHERCVLNCMPKGENFFMQWASKVTDGTRCSVDSYDICVDGKCEVINACLRVLGVKSFCRSIPLFSSVVQWRVIGFSAGQSKCGRENRKIRLPYNFHARTHSRPALLSLARGERIYDTFTWDIWKPSFSYARNVHFSSWKASKASHSALETA